MNMNEEKIKDILSVTIEALTDKDNIKTITFTGMDNEDFNINIEDNWYEATKLLEKSKEGVRLKREYVITFKGINTQMIIKDK